MRWSIKPKSGPRPYEPFIIEKFALFPICINNECRWLERVKFRHITGLVELAELGIENMISLLMIKFYGKILERKT